MFRNLLILLCTLVGAGITHAQSLWLDVPASATPSAGERRIVPEKYRAMHLDLQAIQASLSAAPEAIAPMAGVANMPVIEVPMPDGKTSHFQMVETPVMAPELQAQFPEIRTYTGRGVEDASAVLKMDITPWGFHGMITSANQGSVFIDPMVHGNADFYVVYFKKDYKKATAGATTPWTCDVSSPDGSQELKRGHETPAPIIADQGDTQRRRYRLALACTGEYAVAVAGPSPTVPLVLAAMVTSMNRVNGVYERDFAVTMQMVANNNLLVYLVGSSDPYTNNDGGTMLGQNVTNCNNVIGSANYDIGHVFSTGGGGIAGLNVVCSGGKARGVTGSGSPIGDPFDIDYVAHEMGHQFGGNHTFNHCGGNTGGDPAAVEPGSGTTIMAYAGICGTDDVAAHSEDIFHGYSIGEMGAFIYTGGANTCPVKIASTNHNPIVDAGLNYTIPKSTPFALTATGSDQDGDVLTYTWEQMNTGDGGSPPVSTATVGPLFRSYKGNTSPTRVFPRLQDLVNNVNPVWEELPGVARTMNFQVTLRDNALLAGCTDEDDMVVTVAANSGPFRVTVPNTNLLWDVGSPQTVTWDVANTTAAPVSCSNVRILLSTDGGFTYPVLLADNEPNDGSANITVPNNVSTTCRVKVEGIGNIFFDISNVNFRIQLPAVPTFFLATSVDEATVCAGADATIGLELASQLGFSTPADITVTGAPAGATVSINPTQVVPAGTSSVTISNLTPAMAGVYTLNIQVVAGSVTRTANVTLTVLPGIPAVATLVSPANGATGTVTTVNLSWASALASSSVVEVATSPDFAAGTLVSTQTVSGTTATVAGLNVATVYYWRVLASNFCGAAAISPVFAFQTGEASCGNFFISQDVPKTILSTAVNTVVSTLDIPLNSIIADINVDLGISHSYTGDLIARLVSPTNDTLRLFDQPGVPATAYGCNGSNVDLSFDNEAALNASVLENFCNNTAPSLIGTFQSIDPLSTLVGKNAQGVWKLLVTDNFPEDGGALTDWRLVMCFPTPVTAGNLIANNALVVPSAGSRDVATANLQMTLTAGADQGKFILLSVPAHGTLNLNGTALGIGDSFTQADIDGGLVDYTNNGDLVLSDNFHFDAVDANNNAWVHDAIFNINIVVNNLAATATTTATVKCYNDANGEITVATTGLDGNYTYTLNGQDQSSNVFSGLAAGSYTVVVTGQYGFTISANTVVIDNPAAIVVTTDVSVDDLTVNASGGTGVLEYSLNGIDFQLDNTFADLSNGVYTMTVRDENGCTATTEFIIAVNSLLASASVAGNISCPGESDGSISVNVGGGESPYSYSLNNGAPQPENIFTGLAAGTYTVLITDNVGFTAVSSTIILTDPVAIVASAGSVLNVVTVTATGGTGALQYSLDGGNNFQASNVFNGVTNGTYNVVVRDANGCTGSTTIVVNVPPLALTATTGGSLLCFGNNSGEITAAAVDGIPPYEYKLNNGTYQTDETFTGLAAGNYVVWVRDAVGTEVSFAVLINQPPQLEVAVIVTLNDATAFFNGGVEPYTYTTDAPNEDLQNLPNGTYSVVVTDANGCTAETTFSVNLPPLSWSSVVTNVTCAGQTNGGIAITTSGGISPYEYSLNGVDFQGSNIFNDLAAGDYVVTIRDAEGTLASATVSVGEPTPVMLSGSTAGNSISSTATGGTPPYLYSLNGGALQGNGNFSNLVPGAYTVVATDANGCVATLDNLLITSAVVEPATAWGLTVSPNPGAGLFQLVMQQAPASLHAEVFDAAGRMLHSLDFAPHGGQFTTTLDLRDLPNGTYILRLTDGQQWGGVRLSKVD